MRPIIIVLVVVAVTIAGLTAMLVSRYVSEQSQVPVVSAQTGPGTEDVLVAAVDIKTGAVVKAEDLRYEAWPASAVDPRFVRRGGGDDPKTGFVGTIAKRPLMAGEPISPQAVFRQDESGVLAGMLSPGMRATSIAVTQTGSVSGFILPNDRVDVLLSADMRTASAGGGNSQGNDATSRFSAEVVLSDVRVLAVDDKLVKGDASANIAGHVYTVELSPKDVEILSIAQKLGDLSLVLRSLSPGEAGEAPPAGFTVGPEASRALQASLGLGGGKSGLKGAPKPTGDSSGPVEVRVNRAGSITTQSFSN